MSAAPADEPTAPCNHCGGPVPLDAPSEERDPEHVVRCGFCGTALLIHVENGVRWTEEVERLERRAIGERELLRQVVRLRRRRVARRRTAPTHAATDWKGIRGGCGTAAFGSLFAAGGLGAFFALANGGPGWLLLHGFAFGGFGAAMIALGLRQAWSNRRVTVRADGSRDSPPRTPKPFA
ncbi:hypothetical protein [Alienimonas chondri]|uniref:Uncharacterized protein n=1 Tax=Alienimonas chondri TaxID=2681879 RepID=A0ABX1VG79_9PLAN|nr:hypothetical protein [Alienimonas chondri]NNJ27133.1 hypothetical protein [Alienimonas chondri]